MTQKRCIKCEVLKPKEEFNFKNKSHGRRNARCKECTRKDIRSAYHRNRNHYLRYRSERNKKLRKETIRWVKIYLSNNPCVDCGEGDITVLQFDHVRGVKKMEVSAMVGARYSLGTIQQEIEKCEVRCANCHIRRTARERELQVL